MRWEWLFSDLEAQADALERDELEVEVADRALIEQGSVVLMDRLRASVGLHLRCTVIGGQRWQGPLLGYGLDWLSLARSDLDGQASVLLPVAALTAVSGLDRRAVPLDAVGLVSRRVTIAMALRRLMDNEEFVGVHLHSAPAVAGRIVLVGRDYLDIVDEDAVIWSVPLAAVVAVALS